MENMRAARTHDEDHVHTYIWVKEGGQWRENEVIVVTERTLGLPAMTQRTGCGINPCEVCSEVWNVQGLMLHTAKTGMKAGEGLFRFRFDGLSFLPPQFPRLNQRTLD